MFWLIWPCGRTPEAKMLTQITSLFGLSQSHQNAESPEKGGHQEDFADIYSLSGKQTDLESQVDREANIGVEGDADETVVEDQEIESDKADVAAPDTGKGISDDPDENREIDDESLNSQTLGARRSFDADETIEAENIKDQGLMALVDAPREVKPASHLPQMQVRPDPVSARSNSSHLPIFQSLENQTPSSAPGDPQIKVSAEANGKAAERNTATSPTETEGAHLKSAQPNALAAALRSPIFDQSELRPWRLTADHPTADVGHSVVQQPAALEMVKDQGDSPLKVVSQVRNGALPTPDVRAEGSNTGLGLTQLHTEISSGTGAVRSEAATHNSGPNRADLPDLNHMLAVLGETKDMRTGFVSGAQDPTMTQGQTNASIEADDDLGLTVQFSSVRSKRSEQTQAVPNMPLASGQDMSRAIVDTTDFADADVLPPLDDQIPSQTKLGRTTTSVTESGHTVLQPPSATAPMGGFNPLQFETDDVPSEDEVQTEVALLNASGASRSGGAGGVASPLMTYRPEPTMVMRQVAEALPKLADGQVEIRLNPEELGTVRMQLTQGENGLTVHIITERAETQDLMKRHIDQLARDLADAGFEGASFSFENHDDNSGEGQETLATGRAAEADDLPPLPTPTIASDGLDIRV
ncbi:MAG: flagellar hook-length control protein FliK [Pelagimonas sp.]|jgi:hypothetical protein|nr:flagellar hook-length control protein FliK [Pelagimonas sp.]